jgi:hypothetical protein
MADRIVHGGAHARASARLREARGSINVAFDELGLGFDHDDVLDYLQGAPSFMSLPEEVRGKVAGLCMGVGLTIAEAARVRPGEEQG